MIIYHHVFFLPSAARKVDLGKDGLLLKDGE